MLLPSVAAECFLFQDNNFYCTDLPQQQAQEECSIYPDCDQLIHLSSSPCRSIPSCQVDDIISLPVIVKQNSAQELPVIKNPASQQKPAEPQFTILWLWLSAVVFIVAVYYAFSRNLIPGLKRKKKSRTIEEELELPSAFWPPAINPRIEKKIQSLHSMHQNKVREHQIKSFLAEAGLAVESQQKDIFRQLQSVSRATNKLKQKAYRRWSKVEKKAFDNLEQVIASSKFKTSGASVNLDAEKIRKDLRQAITELRNMASGK